MSMVDGEGRVWAYGEPENGQTVLWSMLPGEDWTKRSVGVHTDPGADECTCPYSRGPRGRGPTIVVTGYPVSHVGLDHGRTWTSIDLGASEPYRTVIEAPANARRRRSP